MEKVCTLKFKCTTKKNSAQKNLPLFANSEDILFAHRTILFAWRTLPWQYSVHTYLFAHKICSRVKCCHGNICQQEAFSGSFPVIKNHWRVQHVEPLYDLYDTILWDLELLSLHLFYFLFEQFFGSIFLKNIPKLTVLPQRSWWSSYISEKEWAFQRGLWGAWDTGSVFIAPVGLDVDSID